MNPESGKDDGLFFWIKGGSEKKENSIQSIHREDVSESPPAKAQPKKPDIASSARAGLKEGWTRATFIVKEDNLKKLKALAYWERKGIKDVLDEALHEYLKNKKSKA